MSDVGLIVEIRLKANFFPLPTSDFWLPTSILVGLGGFEPPTSRLSGVRSKPTEL
jgi:hypothetical protein